VAVVGSGPAGLAAAQQLNRAGHQVTVFERDSKVGGLLRFGIPDFKLDKSVIDRRIEVLVAEGIEFKTNVEIGVDMDASSLRNQYDAVVLCGGAAVRRGLTIPGAQLNGVVQAMDFLKGNNKTVSGEINTPPISARGKHVIVIGGGDTGSDCIGTSIRHGALSVSNFEIMPQGTPERPAHQPWPFYPMRLKTSTSHKEGAERFFSISTKEFTRDSEGKLTGLKTVQVVWEQVNGSMKLKEVPGSEKVWQADLVLLAMGFTGSEPTIAEQLGVALDARTNIQASEADYKTNVPGVFAAGDQRRGQSLIVWAISEGRQAAHYVDAYLMGSSALPLKEAGDLPRV
jgi:glutamate synthase (NADPH/NADH) small chain